MRHLLLPFALLYSVSLAAQLPTYVPTDGLVAWYPLSGDCSDLGPNLHDGTANSIGYSSNRFGQSNQSAHLNGSNAFIGLNFPSVSNTLNALTINAWVKTTDAHGPVCALRAENGGHTLEFNIGTQADIIQNPGHIGSLVRNSCCGAGNNFFGSQVNDNQWHMVTLIRQSNGVLRIYDNAVLINQTGASNGGALQFANQYMALGSEQLWDNSPSSCGSCNSPHQRYLEGQLDDVGFWSRELSVAELSALYSAPAPSTSGCVDSAACNYDATATEDDGSCTYADYGRDCNGNCLGMTPWFVDAGSSGSEATGEPGSPFATIQDALELACPTDTIHIAAGTYSENVNITTSNLTLLGDEEFDPMGSDQTDVVIDANNAGSGLVIDAAEAHVVGLTFTNGNATHGGAVYATNSGSNSILDRCAITNNSGLDLVTSHAQNLQFDQCVVIANSGRNTIVPWKTASFNRCRIQNNNTPDNSNAILAAGDNTQIVNCLIGPNGSKGVYAYGATLLIEHTTITGHTLGCALDAGHFGDASIYMVNSVITENDQDLVVNQTGNLLAQFHIATCILDEPLEYSWESAYSTIEEYGTNIILPALLEEDYSLASTSPGIGVAQTGLTWTGPTPNEPVIDITGAVRPQPAETSADLGAFEHPLGTPEPTFGCTDDTACNYDPAATDDDASCIAPTCDDPTACNYDAEATCGGGTCIPSGCMEEDACNYNAAAQCAGEACDYSCCPGPGCCGAGTHWDANLATCVVDVPDTVDAACTLMNLQELASGYAALVEQNAALDSLLSACEGDGSTNASGPCAGQDYVTYHDYDYAIVEIGDQCWFAENLRTEQYSDDSTIPSGLSDQEWTTTSVGSFANFDAEYGFLYNWFSISDPRGICPNNWHVSAQSDWESLEAVSSSDFPVALKASPTQTPSWDGSNQLGFNAIPAGRRRNSTGAFDSQLSQSYFWLDAGGNYYRLGSGSTDFTSGNNSCCPRAGFSVRCVKD